jgi:two-component system NtrC family sensor kinase
MWAMNTVMTTQNLLAISLLVVILLLVIQTLRLRRRDQEFFLTTEALLAREELATLGRLMAGIAHELNTPLGAVCCSVGTRQKAVAMIDEAVTGLSDPDADQEALLARMGKALKALHGTDPILSEALLRTNQLIRELRLAGRGEADTPQPVDVNSLVQGTLLLLQHELKNAIEVKLELGDVKPVSGWQGPLGQVLLNLVLNARQAMGDQGIITISTSMAAGEVVIKVADNGPGLPKGCADRLFKAGFTTKDADNGTGLGLFIVRKILARHQGRIAASNIPGSGAEFEVTLPALQSAVAPDAN